MQKETNICFQYNAYSLSLIIYNHLCATVCGCQIVSLGGNSVSHHAEHSLRLADGSWHCKNDLCQI